MHAFCITAVGIAKLSPTLVQRATGAAVAGQWDWLKCNLTYSGEVLVEVGGGRSSPPPAFLSNWREEVCEGAVVYS